MSRLLLDTSYVIALIDERDKWHSVAARIQEAIHAAGHEVIVVDPVINEVVGVLARRLREQGRSHRLLAGLDALDQLVPYHRITWVSPALPRLYPMVLAVVREHLGELNFIDALLALSCRELDIRPIVSFDQDFDRLDWLTRVSQPEDLAGKALS